MTNLRNIFLILFIFTFFQTYSQKKLTLKDVNVDSFPKVVLKLNYLNPNLKGKDLFEVKENNVSVKFNFKALQFKEADTLNKAVLIIIEDLTHPAHIQQKKFFQDVLLGALPKIIKPGDKINIAIFDRSRDGKTPLRFLLNDYTDDVNLLSNKIKVYDTWHDQWSYQESSDLYSAIFYGISDLRDKFLKTNPILVVLSGGINNDASNDQSPDRCVKIAEESQIPIYSIQYLIYENRTLNSLAESTYGKHFQTEIIPTLQFEKNKQNAIDSTVSFIKNALYRLHGRDYQISFETTAKQDNNIHTVDVLVENIPYTFQFKSPACNLICMIKSNPLISAIIGFVLLSIIILVIIFFNKNKKTKEIAQLLKEQEIRETQRRHEEEIKRTNEIVNQQKQEIKQKEEEQFKTIQQQQNLQKEKDEQQRKLLDEKRLLQEMTALGKFPRLQYNFSGNVGYFEINKPSFTIGRTSDNYYYINHPTISSKHLQIYFQNQKYYIKDLNSTNGIIINGAKVIEKELKHSDTIQIGAIQLMFIQ